MKQTSSYKAESESSSTCLLRSACHTPSWETNQLGSVWRPIENIVEDYPLAFCDANSVSDEDLVECDHVRRKFKGANFYAHFNPGHKWYYLGEQRPEEVLLLKMFDSDSSGKAKSEVLWF
jgi:hypothetical protein